MMIIFKEGNDLVHFFVSQASVCNSTVHNSEIWLSWVCWVVATAALLTALPQTELAAQRDSPLLELAT
jgi:hypothetical protein